MTDLDPTTRDHLAGEYVIGTLDRVARASVEARMDTDAGLRAAVADWDRRLAPLALTAPPVKPPRHLWSAVDRALRTPQRVHTARTAIPAWQSVGFWRGWSMAASAVAAALIIWVGLTQWLFAPFSPTHIGLIQSAENMPAWLVRLDTAQRRFDVESLAVLDPGPGKDFELWLVLPEAPQPISLGVLAPAGARPADLTPRIPRDLPEGSVLAVSLEAAGGSSTGLPQGPIQYQGPVQAARG